MSDNVQMRIVGVILLIVGGLLAYFEVYQRLQEAARHVPSVMYNMKVVLLVPVSLGFSLVCVIYGERSKIFYNTSLTQAPRFVFIVYGLLIVSSALFVWWFHSTMQAYGYR